MLFPSLDLRFISQQFDAAAPEVVAASRRAGNAADAADHSPSMLQQAMVRLLELLRIIEQRDSPRTRSERDTELDELGDYAIQMLNDLAAAAGSLGLEQQSQRLEDLTLPMALWIARHGGELRSLAPIVNALARLANTLREPAQLGQLYPLTGELVRAADRITRRDLEKTNPGRPWRLLLVNRAIIATRSHQPALIDEAYQQLSESLPEEAPRFFAEGMQQMELLDYPMVVRQVVEKYYNLWSLPRTLH